MRKENKIVRKLNVLCIELEFDPKKVFHNTKLLLDNFSDVKWSVEEETDDFYAEVYDIGGQRFGEAFDFFSDFINENARERFKSRFCTVFDSRTMIEYVEKALLKLRDYPDKGELYYNILNRQYFIKMRYQEQEMLESLRLERSVFYDRKREAIALFGIVLWGYLVPEYKNTIWSAAS